jgi:hypothetical protein
MQCQRNNHYGGTQNLWLEEDVLVIQGLQQKLSQCIQSATEKQ